MLDPTDFVVAVCDNAHEELDPRPVVRLHWSVPDPVRVGTAAAFDAAYDDLATRVAHLAPRPHSPLPRGPHEPRPVRAPTWAGGLVAEFLGTGLLVTVVVGSGIAAQRLSADDVGLQLLENSTATFLGLTVLILMFGPVSGAHFNPVVSAADWLLGRRAGPV